MQNLVRSPLVVLAPLHAEHAADLADRATRTKRVAHREEQVLVADRGHTHALERLRRLVGVPFGAHARRSLELAALGRGVDPLQLDRRLLLRHVLVHADDPAVATRDRLLPRAGRRLVLVLYEALIDRSDGAAELVDAGDQLPRAGLQL